MKKRSGGKASPYDHSPESEGELTDEFDKAQRLIKDEPEGALTPMRIAAMEGLVKLGVPIPVAATSLKCNKRVKEWAKTARLHAESGKKPGFGEGESPYLLWAETMDSARAYNEAYLVQCITQAALTDWKASAWLLERRASKRYHLQSKLEISAGAGKGLEITSFSTDKLLAIAKGLLPAEDIKETRALPADIVDGELVDE